MTFAVRHAPPGRSTRASKGPIAAPRKSMACVIVEREEWIVTAWDFRRSVTAVSSMSFRTMKAEKNRLLDLEYAAGNRRGVDPPDCLEMDPELRFPLLVMKLHDPPPKRCSFRSWN
jgi:hypothetical protein